MTRQEERRISELVEKRQRKALDLLVKRNPQFTREAWLGLAVTCAAADEKRWAEHCGWLRGRTKVLRKLASRAAALGGAARKKKDLEMVEEQERIAEGRRRLASRYAGILRANARARNRKDMDMHSHNHTLRVHLNAVRKKNPKFDCYEQLAGIIAEAYEVVGRERDSKSMTSDALQKLAKRYGKEERR
jgi:hypothetical protein